MISLFTTPDASSTFAQIGVWSSNTFSQYYDVMIMVVGLLLGGMVLSFMIGTIISAFKWAINKFNSDD